MKTIDEIRGDLTEIIHEAERTASQARAALDALGQRTGQPRLRSVPAPKDPRPLRDQMIELYRNQSEPMAAGKAAVKLHTSPKLAKDTAMALAEEGVLKIADRDRRQTPLFAVAQ
jgi:hypothetical protein